MSKVTVGGEKSRGKESALHDSCTTQVSKTTEDSLAYREDEGPTTCPDGRALENIGLERGGGD